MTTIIPEPSQVKRDPGQLVEMAWDPITRIVGSLGIYTKIDFENREVVECHSTSSIFRGYSIFMKGKDPRDAHFITSRICGICGDNHATCSCYAQNMAYGVQPPHLAEWIVNLGEAAEYMFDHNIFQENLVGVDYCEKMVSETNPSVLAKAENTQSPHADMHGYRTIADIMRALNPFTGDFYREALQVSRWTREMFCLMEGRHVHPSTLYPGGVGTVATIQLMTDYMTRLMRYVEFMKKVVPMHDDLFDFFYEALPGYEKVGLRRTLLGCWGSFQDPEVLQLRLQGHGELGPQDVRHARRGRRRQAGHHTPWSTSTSASGSCWAVRITTTGPTRRCSSRPIRWAIRWIGGTRGTSTPTRKPAEAGLRRQLQLGDVAALVRRQGPPGARHRRRAAGPAVVHRAGRTGRHRLCQGHRHSVQINLPKTALKGPVEFEWKIPQYGSNTIERNRARTYFQAYAAACALHFAEKALAEIRAGRTKTWEKFEVPDEGIGCGFTEAVRGVLSHHMVIRDGKIANYHPYPPTPWNANPRDSYGTPGPLRGRGAGSADLRGERPGELQGHRHHAHGAQLRPVPAVRRAHVPGQGQDAGQAALPHPVASPGNDVWARLDRHTRTNPGTRRAMAHGGRSDTDTARCQRGGRCRRARTRRAAGPRGQPTSTGPGWNG